MKNRAESQGQEEKMSVKMVVRGAVKRFRKKSHAVPYAAREVASLRCTHPFAGEVCDCQGLGLMIGYVLGDPEFDKTPGIWIGCSKFWDALGDRLVLKMALALPGESLSEVFSRLARSRTAALKMLEVTLDKIERPAGEREQVLRQFEERYDNLMKSLCD